MTVVEKAAYLKGLVDGLGVEADSKEGKLWAALNDLLADMAHEIEDLQATDMDHAEALDEMAEELSYLEELTCDLDMPEDYCGGECEGCDFRCGDEDEYDDDDDDDEEDEEDDEDDEDDGPEYDGVVYDVTCPVCGEEISFDEDTLGEGSIVCPGCGETLEFDLDAQSDDE